MPPFNANARKTPLVLAGLVLLWSVIGAWQFIEHRRVKEAARAALISRSQDITGTLGLVLRSQRRWGMVSQERLEPALRELVRSGEVISLALLNASGEVVVAAGAPPDFETRGMLQAGERWDARRLTLVNLVDLGLNPSERGETNRPTIVMPPRDREGPPPPPPPRGEDRDWDRERDRDRDRDRDRERERPRGEPRSAATNPPAGPLTTENAPVENPPGPATGTPASPAPLPLQNVVAGSETNPALAGTLTNRSDRPGWPRFGRPPFRFDEAEFKELVERRGLHGLVIAMSTESYRNAVHQDLWLRAIIALFAGVSMVGLGLAWRNLVTNADLQLRLLRASELNTHLKEMNLAAAGLAHETRNPLNIIRGLAQMISKQNDATTEVRLKTREIIEETDRVTAQLNEFINYSRPREVRRTPVPLAQVVGEVARALTYDVEEKCIRLVVPTDLPIIEADEQLLRQALFNLLLNAVQAVERGGQIEVAAWRENGHAAILEIRDNGPGVPEDQRREIFKPYFTTHQKGTGLGLAVVQQIVLAHGWDIEYVPNQPRGAIFRIRHVTAVARA